MARVFHLGVELNAVKLTVQALNGRGRAIFRGGTDGKAIRQNRYFIRMAHQNRLLRGKAGKQQAIFVHVGSCASVFAGFAGGNLAARKLAKKLHAIANTENRNAQRQHGGIAFGRVLPVNAVRPPRKDDTNGLDFTNFFYRNTVRFDNGIHAAFSYATRNQLFVLTAEIEDQDGLIFHIKFLSLSDAWKLSA